MVSCTWHTRFALHNIARWWWVPQGGRLAIRCQSSCLFFKGMEIRTLYVLFIVHKKKIRLEVHTAPCNFYVESLLLILFTCLNNVTKYIGNKCTRNIYIAITSFFLFTLFCKQYIKKPSVPNQVLYICMYMMSVKK